MLGLRKLFTKHCAPARINLRMASNAAAGSTHAAPPAQLDRSAFTQVLTLPALRVPTRKCHELMKKFRGFTFDKPRMKCIVLDGDRQDTRLLLLDEKVTIPGLSSELQQVIQEEHLEESKHNVELDYSYFPADVILRKLLPPSVEVPTSFETVGHIAHLNLRDEQLPYKAVIGQVLLDKNPHIRTVVNKVGSIENEFRVFQMEVLAGEQRTETEVVQHGAKFRLDFAQVYWNSRLETEHSRLTSQFKPGEVLADIMAGIGPFAVPAAQRGLTVYANDLNPNSARYMATNVRINRVAGSVHVFNMDGREFVRLLCATPGGPVEKLPPPPATADADSVAAGAGVPAAAQQQSAADASGGDQDQQQASTSAASAAPNGKKKGGKREAAQQQQQEPSGPVPPIPPGFRPPAGGVLFQHAVMNLPASAVEFLDAFNGSFDPVTWRGRLPQVHCYTFKRAAESVEDVLAKVEHYLGGKLDKPANVHHVRDVAPNKIMLCVSFTVPEAVAFNGREGHEVQVGQQQQQQGGDSCEEGPEGKRQKLEVA